VVKPYFFYPELQQIIRNLVQNETTKGIRKLVFKLIGSLGALDPFFVRQIMLYYNTNNHDPEIIGSIPLLH